MDTGLSLQELVLGKKIPPDADEIPRPIDMQIKTQRCKKHEKARQHGSSKGHDSSASEPKDPEQIRCHMRTSEVCSRKWSTTYGKLQAGRWIYPGPGRKVTNRDQMVTRKDEEINNLDEISRNMGGQCSKENEGNVEGLGALPSRI